MTNDDFIDGEAEIVVKISAHLLRWVSRLPRRQHPTIAVPAVRHVGRKR